MPIYDQSYRAYDGGVRKHFRWWTIVLQEGKLMISNRALATLIVVAAFHLVLRVLQVVAYDTLASNPTNPLASMLRQNAMLQVDAKMFFDYLRGQAPMIFLLSLLAGSGMICNDFRDNLTEVYFSKPLTWRDYVLGKSLTLILLGLLLTAVPGIFLVVLHNLLAPGMKTIAATWWLPFPIMAFSLIMVCSCALCVLASSSIFKGQNTAGVAILMFVIANAGFAQVLAQLVKQPTYGLLAYPATINMLGELMFLKTRRTVETGWMWPAIYVGVICALALWLVVRKARRAEEA